MRAALALCLAGALAAGRPQDGPAPERRGPAEATSLAGLSGLAVTSTVRMRAAPDDPHELAVVWGFPDRARWTMQSLLDPALRRIEYRFGEHAFALGPAASASVALTDSGAPGEPESRSSFLRRDALRRAAFLWPEGAAWGDAEDGVRTAPITSLTGAKAAAGTTLGTLRAELDAHGRPTRLWSADAAGAVEEELAILGWRGAAGRSWPARLCLSFRGEPVWDEEVLEVRTAVRRKDRFFLPADRHALLRPYARPERVRRPAAVARRVALPDVDAGLDAVASDLAAPIAAAAGEALADAGLAIAERWIELDADGRVAAVELRLGSLPSTPPEGWRRVAPADAVRLRLPGRAPPAPTALERLRAGVPEGRGIRRILGRAGEGEVQLLAILD